MQQIRTKIDLSTDNGPLACHRSIDKRVTTPSRFLLRLAYVHGSSKFRLSDLDLARFDLATTDVNIVYHYHYVLRWTRTDSLDDAL